LSGKSAEQLVTHHMQHKTHSSFRPIAALKFAPTLRNSAAVMLMTLHACVRSQTLELVSGIVHQRAVPMLPPQTLSSMTTSV
jgi:hypothetical protein